MTKKQSPAAALSVRDSLTAKDGSIHPLRPASILPFEGRALRDLVVAQGATRTLETGMALGVSTVWIAEALHLQGGGSHVAIDPRQDTGYLSLGRQSVESAGYSDYVEVITQQSHRALPRLEGERRTFELAFIDGMHLFDFALVDFFYVDRMLDDGGVVVFHDMWMPALRKVVGFIRQNRAYELIEWQTNNSAPTLERIGRTLRRVRGGGVRIDRSGWQFRFTSENMCALRKVKRDKRSHTHFESF